MSGVFFSLLLGRLKSALTAIWGICTRYPWQAALCVALCLCWWQYRGKQHAIEQRDDARATIAEMTAAQKVAAERQRQVNNENEARQADLARRADNAELEAGELRRKIDGLRFAADRFAASRRVLSLCGSPSSSPGSASQGDPAGDRNGPGADAVLLTKPEYDEFVANTLRLERVRQWADSLVTEGLAIPVAEFGQPSSPTDL